MTVTNFIWDELSDNIMYETDENGDPTAAYTHLPGPFGELISQDRNGTTSYFHYDGKGSTRSLTDENQNVTDTFVYSAYGEEVARTGVTTNPFGYKGAVGYYTNPETDDIYVRARTYQPASGRWLSKDPLGFVDGMSLYRAYFVPGGVDPSGMKKRKVCCSFMDTDNNKPWKWTLKAKSSETAWTRCQRRADFHGADWIVTAARKGDCDVLVVPPNRPPDPPYLPDEPPDGWDCTNAWSCYIPCPHINTRNFCPDCCAKCNTIVRQACIDAKNPGTYVGCMVAAKSGLEICLVACMNKFPTDNPLDRHPKPRKPPPMIPDDA